MRPDRVLIDTNVLVSAVLFGGRPDEAVQAARRGELTGVVSLHILAEFREVLTRPRFGIDVDLVDSLVEELAEFLEVIPVEASQSSWCIDPDDDPVIAAALAAQAEVIVTGDAHLLGLADCPVPVLTVSALLATME